MTVFHSLALKLQNGCSAVLGIFPGERDEL